MWINIFRLNPSSLLGWGFYTSPWKTFLSNFWDSQRFDIKFWQCILNLICHHLSKLVVTIDKMMSLKNDVLSKWPLRNVGSWTYFFLKLSQLNLVILIQNLGVLFRHLSQVWIWQTRLKMRPKSYLTRLLVQWSSNLVKKCILSFWWITLIFDSFCWFQSVKYTFQAGLFQHFLISRNKSAFDLKFWPVI